jgi:hypothetical protein
MQALPRPVAASVVIDTEVIEEIAALARLWSGDLRGRHCRPMDLRALARRVGSVSLCRR